MKTIRFFILTALLTPLSTLLQAAPMGTAFTYQGCLTDGTEPANNLYEFQFSLFDAATNGIQVGTPVYLTPVPVSNGLFQVTLDFGADALNGDARWLEITVNLYGSDMVPVTLRPRHPLTPAPYSLTATALAGTGNAPPRLTVDGLPAFRLAAGARSPNVIGGYEANSVAPGVSGAVIAGGGTRRDSGGENGGPEPNSITADYGFIGAGYGNELAGRASAIVAGRWNNLTSEGYHSFIGGGDGNSIAASLSSICGGGGNAIGQLSVGGGIGGGLNNSLGIGADCATIAGGMGNRLDGSPYSLIAGGRYNTLWSGSTDVTIGGGQSNLVEEHAYGATVSGGEANAVGGGGSHSTIGGGKGNAIPNGSSVATIGGGFSNICSGFGATVAGGRNNSSSGYAATVAGGEENLSRGYHATVGGGFGNVSGGENTTVAGGRRNWTHGEGAAIGGGANNRNTADYGAIGGGLNNTNLGHFGSIGGGSGNYCDAGAATVAGGEGNSAKTNYATVGGGGYNTASGFAATVGGGGGYVDEAEGNSARGDWSSVGGGRSNVARGEFATLGGGEINVVDGRYAVVPGGLGNSAQGQFSFAAGRSAFAEHDGTFVWADTSTRPQRLRSTATNQFTAQASGGVRFFSDPQASTGVELAPGSGSWSTLSDRAVKDDLKPVDTKVILDRLTRLPMSTWRYKSQASEVRHVGPMAQDFAAAFGVGEDERHISSVDADGVALAAIQGLNQKLEKELAELREEARRHDAENARLRSDLADLRQLLLKFTEKGRQP